MPQPRPKRYNPETGAMETSGYDAEVSDDELAARRATAKLQDARGLGAAAARLKAKKKPASDDDVDESTLSPLQKAIRAKNKKRSGAEAAAALGNR